MNGRETDFEQLVALLAREQLQFILIGGLAAVVHGSGRATFDIVTLEKLIHLKRAAGRPKDLESIAELEALLEERRQQGS